ncbi:MAG: hypothetical protein NE334_04475 [Lentisphaeraceae bacterium]|nr:hypothetical protein [Lentisphaeraceae bacterium]
MGQSLTLLNSSLIRKFQGEGSGLIIKINKAKTPISKLRAVYLAIYNRLPTQPETSYILRQLKSDPNFDFKDLPRVLLKTKQFIFKN